EGSTVRLYVDDSFVADAEVEEGRWLVEAEGILTERRQRVRVDVLEPGTARVLARAEVNFVVDLPEPELASEPEAAATEEVAAADPEPEPRAHAEAGAVAEVEPEPEPKAEAEAVAELEAEPEAEAEPEVPPDDTTTVV